MASGGKPNPAAVKCTVDRESIANYKAGPLNCPYIGVVCHTPCTFRDWRGNTVTVAKGMIYLGPGYPSNVKRQINYVDTEQAVFPNSAAATLCGRRVYMIEHFAPTERVSAPVYDADSVKTEHARKIATRKGLILEYLPQGEASHTQLCELLQPTVSLQDHFGGFAIPFKLDTFNPKAFSWTSRSGNRLIWDYASAKGTDGQLPLDWQREVLAACKTSLYGPDVAVDERPADPYDYPEGLLEAVKRIVIDKNLKQQGLV